MPETATDRNGVVHTLTISGTMTRCGLDASGWSRAVTMAQLAGLVVFCDGCTDEARDARSEQAHESRYGLHREGTADND